MTETVARSGAALCRRISLQVDQRRLAQALERLKREFGSAPVGGGGSSASGMLDACARVAQHPLDKIGGVGAGGGDLNKDRHRDGFEGGIPPAHFGCQFFKFVPTFHLRLSCDEGNGAGNLPVQGSRHP